MQTSSWVAAAKDGVQEFVPVSSTPLEASYQRSTAATRIDYHHRMALDTGGKMERPAPAGKWVANRYTNATHKEVGTFGASIVLGSDPVLMATSNSLYGDRQVIPVPHIDLLQTVPTHRDTTLDGAHRASMTEKHFLQIHDPYDSDKHQRAASFQSGYMLRENMHRHVRSQYHPEDKYFLPPSVQNEIGWGISSKYRDACAKYQDGAAWHGRTGSHITKFSERLLLGARHHLSGPMTNPKLHY
uniref:Uncharacterized protein n=1 Tax=Prymnesium polylepis TaxID=72548 RepID=A0A7S4MG26_9EUKA